MGGGRKLRRRDGTETPAIHLRNRYAAAAPVFPIPASLYPSCSLRVCIPGPRYHRLRRHPHRCQLHLPSTWGIFTRVELCWIWLKNMESNPQIADLIEIRNANKVFCCSEYEAVVGEAVRDNALETVDCVVKSIPIPSIVLGIVKDSETFDFCMCNPPFFKSIEEDGLNPKTSCGGTVEEMVCPGGEQAFITHMIEDSVSLKNSFRWFTLMVGRKAKLVKLGHQFTPGKANLSFMLHDLRCECGAFQVLKSAETFLHASNLSCKTDSSLFSIDVSCQMSRKLHSDVTGISFRILMFEQMPGTILVLVKGSLLNKALSAEDTIIQVVEGRCALIHGAAASLEATLARFCSDSDTHNKLLCVTCCHASRCLKLYPEEYL
ncbi:hypothetical protein GUJ93_ZPchr0006g45544 [Zizania palustris]|uniref:Uncharacterized protein n=1 Tax=Zizania palustris TaxID=103762 RepID=A0A8J5TAM6_ZIZPA|nr:hypothetical protein GUJ93_ZPchr0006g45544 [Zizania palustris]